MPLQPYRVEAESQRGNEERNKDSRREWFREEETKSWKFRKRNPRTDNVLHREMQGLRVATELIEMKNDLVCHAT